MIERTIRAKIAKTFGETAYYRVYVLEFEDKNKVNNPSYAVLSFGDFQKEKTNFHSVKEENGTAQVIIHRCKDLLNIENAYYCWQPRKNRFPKDCPRCVSPLRINSDKEGELKIESKEEKKTTIMEFTKNLSEELSNPDEIREIIKGKTVTNATCLGEEFQLNLSEDYMLRIGKNRVNLMRTKSL